MTKIADLIKHDEFAAYVAQAMIDRSTLFKCGIAATDPVIAERCNAAGAGGNFVNLPFFNELGQGGTYEAEVLVEDTALTVDKVTAAADVAVICRRGKAFGATDLAAMEAGADPLTAIGNGLADWWNKANNIRLIKVLDGALGAVSALVKDVSGETDGLVSADTLLDAAQLLGDRRGELTAYAMNSKTATALQKLEGTDLFKPSEIPGILRAYNGRAIIEDDNIADGVVYLFAPGAVAYNPCKCATPFEAFRDELKSQGGIVSRDASIMHVRGIKWATTTANPDNAALATAGNYSLVYPAKAVRVCKLVAKIG